MLVLTAAAMCDAVEAVTGITTAGHALGFVNSGYDRVLSGLDPRSGSRHLWSFLSPLAELVLTPTVTGTATGVYDGSTYTVITATTAMFSPTQVGDDITVTDTGTYEITNYETSSKVWIEGDHAFTGKAVSLYAAGIYDLPTDFEGLLAGPVYAYHADGDLYTILPVGIERIFEEWRGEQGASFPQFYAIVAKTLTASTGQRWQMMVALRPDERRVLRYQYMVAPSALTDSGSVYPLGGGMLAQTVLTAALAEFEESRAMPGQYVRKYDTMMAASIDADSQIRITSGELMMRAD